MEKLTSAANLARKEASADEERRQSASRYSEFGKDQPGQVTNVVNRTKWFTIDRYAMPAHSETRECDFYA